MNTLIRLTPLDEPVIEGKVVKETPSSDSEPLIPVGKFSFNALGWVIGLAIGVGFIAGAALTENTFQKQAEAQTTRRKPRRK
ncbi:MAG: hypothetical protein SF097_14845 [Acidobacteriota bacterium]|nr:hypothetical protein [Acidobacteriota bacterium]